jgi:hypothetical protein
MRPLKQADQFSPTVISSELLQIVLKRMLPRRNGIIISYVYIAF